MQIDRISNVTGVSKDKLEALVEQYTEGRDLGLFGESPVD
ncbi:potassium-transporting ATPase subunit C [Brevibacillus massiliensis]|nr:potassium-transporting ATPase subunit C [Brevibacillus massiliensis]